jgi:hypothetical protein
MENKSRAFEVVASLHRLANGIQVIRILSSFLFLCALCGENKGFGKKRFARKLRGDSARMQGASSWKYRAYFDSEQRSSRVEGLARSG